MADIRIAWSDNGVKFSCLPNRVFYFILFVFLFFIIIIDPFLLSDLGRYGGVLEYMKNGKF